MTATTTTQRGFKVTCICCGSEEAIVRLDLDDLNTFSGTECENEFSAEDVRTFIGQWQAVLKWIEQAPTVEE